LIQLGEQSAANVAYHKHWEHWYSKHYSCILFN